MREELLFNATILPVHVWHHYIWILFGTSNYLGAHFATEDGDNIFTWTALVPVIPGS